MRNNKISNRKNPPPPKITKNNTGSGSSLIGNVLGGLTSGFGVGTGIEAARGVFGARSPSNEVSNHKNNCEMLFKLIEICEKKENSNCDHLMDDFSKKCLNFNN